MTVQSPSPRSPLAERILPARSLFRRSAPPSRRAARERVALHVATLLLLVCRPYDTIAEIAATVGLVGLFFTALWLLGEGLRAEDDWRARPAARRPRLPLKIVAAGVMGTALCLAFAAADNGTGTSIATGVVGAVLHLLAFGIDPLRDKHDTLVTAQDADRVEDLAMRGTASLAALRNTLQDSGAPGAIAEGARLDAATGALLSALAVAPAGLPRCRRALTVWLPALVEAAARFAPLHRADPDQGRTAELVRIIARVRASIEALTHEVRRRADDALSRDLAVLDETSH